MSILNAIERARTEPPFADSEGISPETRYTCKVLAPAPWNKAVLEKSLGFEIPHELAEFWNACGGLVLYEDDLDRIWGLLIFPPTDQAIFPPSKSTFMNLNQEFREDKAEWLLPGDLIIGRFWGDRERPMIRCDKGAPDYGHIMVVSEIGERDEWHWAASSLAEFLTKFMDAHGEKYWTYHYQKELAERAAQQNPEGK